MHGLGLAVAGDVRRPAAVSATDFQNAKALETNGPDHPVVKLNARAIPLAGFLAVLRVQPNGPAS